MACEWGSCRTAPYQSLAEAVRSCLNPISDIPPAAAESMQFESPPGFQIKTTAIHLKHHTRFTRLLVACCFNNVARY